MRFAYALTLTACGASAGGEAELTVRTYGEEYIEDIIPADVFDDGWAVHFDRFLINLGDVQVAEAGTAATLTDPRFQVFDLTEASDGEGQLVGMDRVVAGAYNATQYKVYPADKDSVAGNASAENLALMKDGGYSVYVAGKATKGDVTKTFAWGFKTRTHYEECESQAVIEDGAPDTVQITVHGDHLFYDDLYSQTPMLLFGLVASADDMGDADGVITQAELEAVDLRPLSNYQVGSTDIVDLWHFIEHQTTTVGHIDGEGHCKNTRES